MREIVLASSNKGKLNEIRLAFNGNDIIHPQEDYHIPPFREAGLTFVENAIQKARHAASYINLPVIADDSGLFVVALNGRPGIFSARYAGEGASDTDNIQKILNELGDLPFAQREALFYCCMVYLQYPEDPMPIICEGKWRGFILFKPQGHQGFGYDPIFYVTTHNCSAAELSSLEKQQVSHRGQALNLLLETLHKRYEL
jgi:XTP/dITP diphosphohydrolase